MPIFEYVCKSCGKEFEKLLPNAAEHPACPHCGENKEIVRKLSRFAPSAGENRSCPSQAFCPAAGSGGCGCGHAGCGHHRG